MGSSQVEVGAGVLGRTFAVGDEPSPAASEVRVGAVWVQPRRCVEVGQSAIPVAQVSPRATSVAVGIRPPRIEVDRLVIRSDRLAESPQRVEPGRCRGKL